MKKPKERGVKYKTARISYITNYIIIVLLLFFLTLLHSFELDPQILQLASLGIIFFVLLLLFEPEAERVLRYYLITNSEIVKIEGIIIKKRITIPYQSIAHVRAVKGVWGRIFNFGTILVKGIKDDIVMKGMKEPDVISRMMENKIALMKRPARKGAKIEKSD